MIIALLLAAVTSAPTVQTPPPPVRFDLICTTDSAQPISRRVAVDLVSGRYCFTDQCTPRPVADVDVQTLRLRREGGVEQAQSFQVDRRTGAYYDEVGVLTRGAFSQGRCVVAPFSGLAPR